MRSLSRGMTLTALCLLAASVSAALAQPYVDWGNGPAKWLMTREERRAWASVETDEQAKDFVELFCARRDPTPGTWQNEFRTAFDQRVKYADENYAERGERGSMTERGRALVVLGFAPNLDTRVAGCCGGARMSDRRQTSRCCSVGDRVEWLWQGSDAQQKFGMPRVEVVFVQDRTTLAWTRDTHRPDFALANENAINAAIRNPELTSVPDWARTPAPRITRRGG